MNKKENGINSGDELFDTQMLFRNELRKISVKVVGKDSKDNVVMTAGWLKSTLRSILSAYIHDIKAYEHVLKKREDDGIRLRLAMDRALRHEPTCSDRKNTERLYDVMSICKDALCGGDELTHRVV